MSLLSTSSLPLSWFYDYTFNDPFYRYPFDKLSKRHFDDSNTEHTDTHTIHKFEFPGLRKEDLIVELDSNVLYLRGQTKLTGKNMSKVVTYFDSISVPNNLTEQDVECSYENGLLFVKIPKVKSEAKRRINIV